MKNPFIIIALTLFVVVGILSLMMVHDKSEIKSGSSLPMNATQIQEVGPGWYEFSYSGKRILFYQTGIGDNTRAAMTVIGDE